LCAHSLTHPDEEHEHYVQMVRLADDANYAWLFSGQEEHHVDVAVFPVTFFMTEEEAEEMPESEWQVSA
jgi:hypothetical protein